MLELPGGERWAIEIKSGLRSKPEKGFYHALEDIEPHWSFVVHAGADRYPLAEQIEAISVTGLVKELRA